MRLLIKETFVRFNKKIGQFISLIFLTAAVVMAFGALFGNSQNLKNSFYAVKNNSHAYDYNFRYNHLALSELGYKLIIYKLQSNNVETLTDDDFDNAKKIDQSIIEREKKAIDSYKEVTITKNENKEYIKS